MVCLRTRRPPWAALVLALSVLLLGPVDAAVARDNGINKGHKELGSAADILGELFNIASQKPVCSSSIFRRRFLDV